MEKRLRTSTLIAAGTAVAGFVFIACALLSLTREYGESAFLMKEDESKQEMKKLGEQFAAAARKGDSKRMEFVAKRLIEMKQGPPPSELPAYSEFFRNTGLNPNYLKEPFGETDCSRWRDLSEMKALADGFASVPPAEETARRIFDAVAERVKDAPSASAQRPPSGLMDAWRRGEGGARERMRLVCGIAFQAGYECQVVGLFSQPGLTIRELCELRKDGKIVLVDTAANVLFEGIGLDGLSKMSMLIPKSWTAEQRAALKGPYARFVPAEPQDYRCAEHFLRESLALSGAAGLPRLPEEPAKARNSLEKLVDIPVRGGFALYWSQSLDSMKAPQKEGPEK